MILKAGLTGGIGSGKSTIRRMFESLGCITLDADALVAELYEPGADGHRALVREYGESVLDAGGRIDRKRLSAVAFSTADEAQRLNRLIHPIVIDHQARIAEELQTRVGADDAIFIVEATLLLESGGRARYDRIIVVDVDPATQVQRGLARGLERGELQRRIRHQMTRDQRLQEADYVIDNNGAADDTLTVVKRVHELLWEDLWKTKRAPDVGPGL